MKSLVKFIYESQLENRFLIEVANYMQQVDIINESFKSDLLINLAKNN